MEASIPVTLLSGILGAGKTTLLKHIVTSDHEYDIAVVINDMGEINVDANLIERHIESDDIIELSNGCICCSMQGDLEESIINLATSEDFDYLLIEPSGISNPKPVAKELINGRSSGYYHLDSITTVVDARRFYDEFVERDATYEKGSDKEKSPLNRMVDGIEFCDTVVINKKDIVTETEINNIIDIIQKIQPKAKILPTEFGSVEPEKILDTDRFDAQEVANSPRWKQVLTEQNPAVTNNENHHNFAHSGEDHQHISDTYDIDSFVYQCHRPMHPKRFAKTLQMLPDEIIRIKGRAHIAGIPDYALNLSVSGSHAYVDVSGRWIASLPESRQQSYRQTREMEWDSTWGDRETKVVVIGQEMDSDSIRQLLNGCACSGVDLQDTEFENPFPQNEGEYIQFVASSSSSSKNTG